MDGLLSVGKGLVRREVPLLFCEIPKEHRLDGKKPRLDGKEHRLVGKEHRLDGKDLFGAGRQFFNISSSDV